jgi:hypothetical protein
MQESGRFDTIQGGGNDLGISAGTRVLASSFTIHLAPLPGVLL